MPPNPAAAGLLSAMITPAVLISACGAMVFSTSARLGRIVDRVRELSALLEKLSTGEITDFAEERRVEAERQLSSHAERGRLIQASLTSLYVALGVFVATTISTAIAALVPAGAWVPAALGVAGTLVLFYACLLLIRETRIALASVNQEMAFVLRLRDKRREK
jgi:threonine/homoserine/homoserine lactone efflux protein